MTADRRAALVERMARAHCKAQGYEWDCHPDFHHVWKREAVAICDLALEEAALEIERKCRALPKSDRLRAYDFASAIRDLKAPQ